MNEFGSALGRRCRLLEQFFRVLQRFSRLVQFVTVWHAMGYDGGTHYFCKVRRVGICKRIAVASGGDCVSCCQTKTKRNVLAEKVVSFATEKRFFSGVAISRRGDAQVSIRDAGEAGFAVDSVQLAATMGTRVCPLPDEWREGTKQCNKKTGWEIALRARFGSMRNLTPTRAVDTRWTAVTGLNVTRFWSLSLLPPMGRG